MKLSALNALATCLVAANAIQIWKNPSVEDAAVNARTLIKRESLVNVNTIYQEGEEKGLPASFVEYYADCGDGNPVILAVDMATSFKNIKEGSPYSLTVRVGDHGPHEHVNPKYPGSRPYSVAGSPRMNLRGKLEDIKEEEVEELQRCFVARHKDAVWWLPGNPIHETHFVRFMVDDAYFLGGFGDTGYIGKIPKELYHNASAIEEDDVESKHHKISEPSKDHEKEFAHEEKAFKYEHTVKKSISKLYRKIDDEIASLKLLLNDDAEKKEKIDHESTKEFLEIANKKLGKREEQTPLKLDEDLSKDQITSLIEELEKLRSEVHKYGEKLLSKFNSEEHYEKDEEGKHHERRPEGKHHKGTEGKHHKGPEGKHHKGPKGKHHKGPKERHHKSISKDVSGGLRQGDYTSEEIYLAHNPDAEELPEEVKGKTVRVIEDPNVGPGMRVYHGEDYYKDQKVEGKIPDEVVVVGKSKPENKHHKSGKSGGKGPRPDQEEGPHHPKDKHAPKHHAEDPKPHPKGPKGPKGKGCGPKPHHRGHHEERPHHPSGHPEPGFFSGLFHVFDFLKGPRPEPPMVRDDDFKQRRPKNVKLESDLKHDFESIGKEAN